MDSNVSFPEGWTAPSELLGPLPRRMRMERGGICLVVFATALLLGGGAWFLSSFRESAQEMARTVTLRRGSREATGVVTRVWSKGRNEPEMVSYAFSADGVALTGECSTPFLFPPLLREGDRLAVRFLPSDPAINHPAVWEGPSAGRWVACVFWAAMAIFGIWIIIQLRRERRLLAEGVPAAGVILKCYPGGRGAWTAKHQFRTEDGRIAKGSGTFSERLEIGSIVCVLYLPRDPRRNKPYAGLSYRLAQ